MKNLFTFIICFAIVSITQAQVQIDLSFNIETQRYTVSFLAENTWEYPQNITGTGQVTIKVPTGQFEVKNLINHLEDVEWLNNARSNSPVEAPEYDYISFGLMTPGTDDINYIAGELRPLFSFENEYGCTGGIALMSNEEDPFYPPNEEMANVGNSLSVLGGGSDAYAGNVSSEFIACEEEEEEPEDPINSVNYLELTAFSSYPNPAINRVNLVFDWEKEAQTATIHINDGAGKNVLTTAIQLQNGKNTSHMDVKMLTTGIYYLQLVDSDHQVYTLGKFVKGH